MTLNFLTTNHPIRICVLIFSTNLLQHNYEVYKKNREIYLVSSCLFTPRKTELLDSKFGCWDICLSLYDPRNTLTCVAEDNKSGWQISNKGIISTFATAWTTIMFEHRMLLFWEGSPSLVWPLLLLSREEDGYRRRKRRSRCFSQKLCKMVMNL